MRRKRTKRISNSARRTKSKTRFTPRVRRDGGDDLSSLLCLLISSSLCVLLQLPCFLLCFLTLLRISKMYRLPFSNKWVISILPFINFVFTSYWSFSSSFHFFLTIKTYLYRDPEGAEAMTRWHVDLLS